jgi:hypothetical protein
MAKLKSLIQTVNVLTGAATRHNRALREIGDLLQELNNFLAEYNAPEKVFENVVKARVDISTLMYKIRKGEEIFKHIKDIKGKRVTPLITEVYNNLENVRVDVYNLKKGKVVLHKSLSNLNASVQTLTKAISDIEFK